MKHLVRDRNTRAWAIADARGGARAVFEGAVSSAGVQALRRASRSIMSGKVPKNDLDRLQLARMRLEALADVFEEMREDGVHAFDMGWTVKAGTASQGMLPARCGGVRGVGGEAACKVVSRLLGERPAGEGLTALAVLVEGAEIPEPVELNERGDPLLPSSVAMVGAGSSLAHAGLFAVETRLDSGLRPGRLPWLDRDTEGPLLPLALYSLLTRAPGRGRGGRGAADLALRIFVEGLCSVMKRDWQRAERLPVSVSTTLREFLSWFYAGRQPRPNEYWPRLMMACEALDRHESRIAWRDPETGRSGLRRVVSLGDIPRGPHALDDLVTLVVHLPPGSRTGPRIRRGRLRYWGCVSEPAYRALLALAYQWHRPGVTRIPGKGRGEWVQSQDPESYAPYTRDRIVELCYPTSVHASRRVLVSRAWQVIHRLEEAGDVRVVGQRILPPRDDLEVVM